MNTPATNTIPATNTNPSLHPSSRIGGHLVADALAVQGVDTIFGVPGESYLPVLDGLYRHPDIRFVICRQEGGAAFMADAYAKLTGKPGVLMVTRGPGATNASIGIHTAHQDSSPMVVLVGQVGNDMMDREAFQEIDYRRMFGPMVKWVAQVDQVQRIPEYFAHAFQLASSGRKGPVVLALPEDPNYIGDVGIGINPELAARIKRADLILALGPRLGEMTTGGYTLFEVPTPKQAIAHVHPGNDELGRVYQTRWMINASMPSFMDALIKLSSTLVVQALRELAPTDTILTNGAGNFATWAHRFWRYGPMRTQLAPTSGAMGYGIPAAVAASICHPDRTVVCFAGDGDFLMTAQEFATAVQYQAGFVAIIFNNSMYGTIRMHQERDYPARVYGTSLSNPDFSLYAKAFGGWGCVVNQNSEIRTTLEKALTFARTERKPAVVELRVSQQTITPNLTIDQLRGKSP
ncbi:MAG: thiamine pyrophosphate-binding protein [Betaproteobacteria bacterium]|nr:thiamine pyrophosphate-binding protein [Betaproteobacteria bacterium]